MTSIQNFDLVVVGGGLAGLSAAARAAELGLRALVLEKGEDERYPCNSRFSGGILHVSYNDVTKPSDTLATAIGKAAGGGARQDLIEALAEDAGRMLEWLQAQGVRFMRASAVEWHRWCMTPARPVSPGLDWRGRGPDVALRLLVSRIEALGGAVMRGRTAKELIMDQGRCVGVVAELSSGEEERWHARSVVIADGGFQADQSLFNRFIGPAFPKVFQRGAATGTGDGLRMAEKVGADIASSTYFYGHILCRDAFANERVWPYPELDAITASGLVVGSDGVRIADEGKGGIALANTLAQQPDPSSFVAVFDQAIWEGPGRSARIPANPLLERAGGTVLRAKSVGQLASQLNMSAERLEASVIAHNDAIRNGTTAELVPPRTTDSHAAMPIDTASIMAIPICPGITYTMGGIAIDGRARVLRGDGTAIEGLYAAGSATGGLEGAAGHLGYVGGLTKAGVLGLRAAETIADHARQERVGIA